MCVPLARWCLAGDLLSLLALTFTSPCQSAQHASQHTSQCMSQPHTIHITTHITTTHNRHHNTCHNHTQQASQYMSQPHTTGITTHITTTHNRHHNTCHNHTQQASQYMSQPHTTRITIHVTTTRNRHHDTTHITIHTKCFSIQVTTILLSVSGHLLKLTSTCMSTLTHVSETLSGLLNASVYTTICCLLPIYLCVFFDSFGAHRNLSLVTKTYLCFLTALARTAISQFLQISASCCIFRQLSYELQYLTCYKDLP